jgi:predicted peroxiredoxin
MIKLFAILSILFSLSFAETDKKEELLVNLTSSDDLRAPMAIAFAVRSLKAGYKTTLLLNVEGVRLAVKSFKAPVCPDGKSVRVKLEKFVKLGGEILVCPMCLEMQGYAKSQLIDNVSLAGADVVFPKMRSIERVISY